MLGATGRAILDQLIAGRTDPELLASLAKGRLRDKREELERALRGLVSPHVRLMLAVQLGHIDSLDEGIERLSREIEVRMRPFGERLANLRTIPGVGQRTPELILAEVGPDMGRFPQPQAPGVLGRINYFDRRTQEKLVTRSHGHVPT